MRNNTRSGVLALGVLTLAFAAPANAISIGGTEFVLFANTRIALESAATNITGNVAVNGPAGVLDIGSNVRIAGRAIANRINAGTGALIDTCEFNVKTGPGVCSAEVSPAGVPLSAWPPLPIAAVPACVDSAPNVTVAAGATLNLAPGCYGLVTVNDGGQLILAAGGYDVLDLQLEDGATIDGAGPAATTLSSKRVMTFKPNVIVTDIRIQTPLGMPGFASAEAIQVGNNNQVTNSLLYAPFARIHLHTGTIGTGSEAVANTLVIERTELSPPLPAPTCSLTITKTCQVTGAAAPFTVTFSGTVTNTTLQAPVNVNVTNVSAQAVNPACPANAPCQVPGFPTTLGPGQSVNYSSSYQSNSTVNSDTVTANGNANQCTASATATCATQGSALCPQDPAASSGGSRTCTRFVIDTNNPGGCQTGGLPTHPTWTAALANAVAGDVICICRDTTENVVIPTLPGSGADLTITECTTATVRAADPAKPAVVIRNTASNLTIIGPETIGGSIGWCIDPGASGHALKSVRALSATGCGLLDRGGNNEISFNLVQGSGVGVCIGAGLTDVRGGTVQSNGVGVIFDSATASSFMGARVQGNGPASPPGATSGVALQTNTANNEVRNNRCGVNNPDLAADICNGGAGNTIISNPDCVVAQPAACILPTFTMPANCN